MDRAPDASAPGARQRRTPGSIPSQPLIGRSRELDRLLEVWEAAQRWRGSGGEHLRRGGHRQDAPRERAADARARAGARQRRPARRWTSAARLRSGCGRNCCASCCRACRAPRPRLPGRRTSRGWCRRSARCSSAPAAERPFVSPDLERARLLEATVAAIEWAARAASARAAARGHPHRRSLEPRADRLRRAPDRRRCRCCSCSRAVRCRAAPRSDRLEHALRSRGLLREELVLAPLEPAAVAEIALDVAALDEEDVARVVDGIGGQRAARRGDARARSPAASGSSRRGCAARCAARSGRSVTRAGSFVELAAVAARELEHAEVAALPIEDSAEAAVRGARQRDARGARAAHRLPPRAAARGGLLRTAPSLAGLRCTRAGRGPCSAARPQRGPSERRRLRGTCASPAGTQQAVEQLGAGGRATRARWAR